MVDYSCCVVTSVVLDFQNGLVCFVNPVSSDEGYFWFTTLQVGSLNADDVTGNHVSANRDELVWEASGRFVAVGERRQPLSEFLGLDKCKFCLRNDTGRSGGTVACALRCVSVLIRVVCPYSFPVART